MHTLNALYGKPIAEMAMLLACVAGNPSGAQPGLNQNSDGWFHHRTVTVKCSNRSTELEDFEP